jgi:hypothetical protein
MIIFDKLCFTQSKISPIEALVFAALKNYELRGSVISKWFDYMLDYLAILIHSNTETQFSTLQNESDQRLPSTPQSALETNYFAEADLGLHFENLKSEYMNCNREANIIGCIKTIQRWI